MHKYENIKPKVPLTPCRTAASRQTESSRFCACCELIAELRHLPLGCLWYPEAEPPNHNPGPTNTQRGPHCGAYGASRLADTWAQQDPAWQRPIGDVPDKALHRLAEQLSAWRVQPTGTEGYKKAEVTLGGVDTQALSSQTMESRQNGLYFIGEVVDVTGWLGGYNFQWAWASGFACAQSLRSAESKLGS